MTPEEVTAALAEPFDAAEVKFKPQVVSGNRALAIGYVDARVIQDRLDDVLGVGGWQDDYECLSDGNVVCRLRLRLGGEWITKVDVGNPSEQQDGGDRLKAAFSDALKRAAVKFGIGRYLYRLPSQWVDYDPQKKQIKSPPNLPDWANPRSARKATPAKAASPQKPPANALPADGKELKARLQKFDDKLTSQGKSAAGELMEAVAEWGEQQGLPGDMADWPQTAIPLAVEEAKRFEQKRREKAPAAQTV